jgi:hypothetical protein
VINKDIAFVWIKNLIAILAGCCAVTIATLVPAVALTGSYPLSITGYIFGIAFLHSVILGLPVYILLPLETKTNWRTPLIVGFLIGCVPTLLFWGAGAIRLVNNMGDFLNILIGLLIFGTLGIIGAMTTWRVWLFFQKYQSQNGHNP